MVGPFSAPEVRNKSPQAGPLLVILDMNGVLVLRNSIRKDTGDPRPFLDDFLQMLFVELRGRVQVAVWSSMMEHNLWPLVQIAFGAWTSHLAFVWDQRWCTEKWVKDMHKPLLRKDLKWLRDTQWASCVPNRVVLIDDDAIKCSANPRGTAVHPAAWTGSPEDSELPRLAEYIKAMAMSGEAVPQFQQGTPFDNFMPGEDGDDVTIVENGSSSSRPAKRQRTEGNEGPRFLIGQDVESYWPDDDTWLLASVLKLESNGEYRVKWTEDETESIVPPDYIRRKAPLKPPPGAVKARLVAGPGAWNAGQQGRVATWKRMESRRTPGVYYYYNTDTGASQPEPPSPWEMREVKGRPGQFYYMNASTGERSQGKPAL
mmetsp:Transcript_64797/g.182810  ORF Transcript_64797/g.182810 Transcript_64797/m.182810 type:complete len:372 (-) Transcript_64797:46-1161(-)